MFDHQATKVCLACHLQCISGLPNMDISTIFLYSWPLFPECGHFQRLHEEISRDVLFFCSEVWIFFMSELVITPSIHSNAKCIWIKGLDPFFPECGQFEKLHEKISRDVLFFGVFFQWNLNLFLVWICYYLFSSMLLA